MLHLPQQRWRAPSKDTGIGKIEPVLADREADARAAECCTCAVEHTFQFSATKLHYPLPDGTTANSPQNCITPCLMNSHSCSNCSTDGQPSTIERHIAHATKNNWPTNQQTYLMLILNTHPLSPECMVPGHKPESMWHKELH